MGRPRFAMHPAAPGRSAEFVKEILRRSLFASPAKAGVHGSVAQTSHRLVRPYDCLMRRRQRTDGSRLSPGMRRVICVPATPDPDFFTSSRHEGMSLMALNKAPHPEVPRALGPTDPRGPCRCKPEGRPRRTHDIDPADQGSCPAHCSHCFSGNHQRATPRALELHYARASFTGVRPARRASGTAGGSHGGARPGGEYAALIRLCQAALLV
jgi:hypothetical protein